MGGAIIHRFDPSTSHILQSGNGYDYSRRNLLRSARRFRGYRRQVG